MNKYFPVALIFILWSSGFGKTDLDKLGMVGKIKEQIMTKFVQNGKNKTIESKMVIKFNQQGYKIEETVLSPDDAMINKTTYAYGANSILNEKNVYDSSGKLIDQYIYEYEKDGKTVKQYETKAPDNSPTNILQYDDKGNLTASNDINIDIKYDNKGFKTNEYIQGDSIRDYIYNSDKKLKSIKITKIGKMGQDDITINAAYEYDKEGKLSAITTADSSRKGIKVEEAFKYDPRGNISDYKIKEGKAEKSSAVYNYKYWDTIEVQTENSNTVDYENITDFIKSVKASSTKVSKNPSTFNYKPENTIDGNISTCWEEAVEKGSGEGEWIEYTFISPVFIYRMDVANGFQWVHEKYGDLYKLNSRLKIAKIFFNADEKGKLIEFKDTKDIAQFIFNVKNVQKVKILIVGVYKGDKWDDTSISEATFFGKIQ